MSKRSGNRARRSIQGIGAALTIGAMLVGGAATSARSAEANGVVSVTFGENNANQSLTPLYAAVDEGFFKKAGLDVSIQLLSGGTPSAMAAFAGGSINMMAAGSAEIIDYLAKKVVSGKIIGEIQDSTYDLVVSKDITSIPQLAGKVLGISGLKGQDQIWMEALLQHYGVSVKGVTFLTTGNPVNRLTALSTGAVQAVAAVNANREMSEKTGTVLLKSGDSPVKIPNVMILASSDLITNHKDALVKFLRVLGQTTAWIKGNPNAAAVDCSKGSGSTVADCLSAFTVMNDASLSGAYTWSSTFAINTEGTQAALTTEGLLTPEAKNLKLEDVIDTSIAAKP